MPKDGLDDDDQTDIAERADRLRLAVTNANGPAAVANRAKMPLPTLTNYLGGRDMKASAMVKLAAACNVTVQWLANGTDGIQMESNAEGAIFGRDMMERPANFWLLVILIRTCQEAFSRAERPTLREVIEWVAPSYRRGHALPDRPIELKNPEEPKS